MKSDIFIKIQSQKFESFLKIINEDTRFIIRKNKQLNELYDMFLDFIIDSKKLE
jgi:hypothetical protein